MSAMIMDADDKHKFYRGFVTKDEIYDEDQKRTVPHYEIHIDAQEHPYLYGSKIQIQAPEDMALKVVQTKPDDGQDADIRIKDALVPIYIAPINE